MIVLFRTDTVYSMYTMMFRWAVLSVMMIYSTPMVFRLDVYCPYWWSTVHPWCLDEMYTVRTDDLQYTMMFRWAVLSVLMIYSTSMVFRCDVYCPYWRSTVHPWCLDEMYTVRTDDPMVFRWAVLSVLMIFCTVHPWCLDELYTVRSDDLQYTHGV